MPLLPPSDYRPERAAALRAALLAAVAALGASGAAAAEPQRLGGVPLPPEVSPISIAWVPTTEDIEAAKESAKIQAQQRRPLPEKEGFIVYEVRIDDTLWGLARTHGTTVQAIREANGRIPGGENEAAGDTVWEGGYLYIPVKPDPVVSDAPAGGASADFPKPGEVVAYAAERRMTNGRFRRYPAIAKAEGDEWLRLLADFASFEERPRPRPGPDGIVPLIRPVPANVSLSCVRADGATNVVCVWAQGSRWLVSDGRIRERFLPAAVQAAFESRVAAWEAADVRTFRETPLPCRYRLGDGPDGGTLSGVAELFYGKAAPWVPLWNANKDVAPDPDHVPMGTELLVPNIIL